MIFSCSTSPTGQKKLSIGSGKTDLGRKKSSLRPVSMWWVGTHLAIK